MDSFLWKIGGEAGFGIMSTGVDFSKLAAKAGYHTAAYAEYPSLIRGGHNTYEVHVAPHKVRSSKHEIDMLVCLNAATYELHRQRLGKNSFVLYDREIFKDFSDTHKAFNVPFKRIVREHKGAMVMMNTVAMGASLAVLGWPLDNLFELMKRAFADKGDAVVELNMSLAKGGYESVEHQGGKGALADFPVKANVEPTLVMTGNDAFALAAVAADCRMYVAYPMTPSSTILERLAAWGEKTGMVVRHAEDEISVIITALGGSFAGVRAACGTSGGGFALMNEAVSLAGVAEIPLVIFLGQRPGPATGLPTWTEQGDLLYAVHAGHGEFPKIVLAPGDIEEMYTLGAEAFNLADIYQTPVIVMSDKHLSESCWSTSKLAYEVFLRGYQVERGKIVRKDTYSPYLRYKLTDDGVSPMLVPGQKDTHYQTNSYEHDEYGHSCETAHERVNQVKKRTRKIATYLSTHYKAPQVFGSLDDAKDIFVSWGSNKGVVIDAMEVLTKSGKNAAYIHFTHIFPLDEALVKPLFAYGGRYILVENNSQAQFGRLLRQETGIDIKEKLLKYDGRQIFIEDVLEFVAKDTVS